MKKLITKSGLTIFLLLFQQSLFAQKTDSEIISDTYYNFLIVVVLLLIASIFISLEILDDPKYESQNNLQINKSVNFAESLLSPGNEFDKNVTTKLTIAFYSAGLLVVIYAVLILLML